jgi:hypothetical protein
MFVGFEKCENPQLFFILYTNVLKHHKLKRILLPYEYRISILFPGDCVASRD